jgi:hypothetical protein
LLLPRQRVLDVGAERRDGKRAQRARSLFRVKRTGVGKTPADTACSMSWRRRSDDAAKRVTLHPICAVHNPHAICDRNGQKRRGAGRAKFREVNLSH